MVYTEVEDIENQNVTLARVFFILSEGSMLIQEPGAMEFTDFHDYIEIYGQNRMITCFFLNNCVCSRFTLFC